MLNFNDLRIYFIEFCYLEMLSITEIFSSISTLIKKIA